MCTAPGVTWGPARPSPAACLQPALPSPVHHCPDAHSTAQKHRCPRISSRKVSPKNPRSAGREEAAQSAHVESGSCCPHVPPVLCPLGRLSDPMAHTSGPSPAGTRIHGPVTAPLGQDTEQSAATTPTEQLQRTDGTSTQILALAYDGSQAQRSPPAGPTPGAGTSVHRPTGTGCSQEPGAQAPTAGSAPGSHLQARRPGAEAGLGDKGLAPPLCLRDPVPGPRCSSRTAEGWPLRTGQPPAEEGRAPAPAQDIPPLPSGRVPSRQPRPPAPDCCWWGVVAPCCCDRPPAPGHVTTRTRE